jgi:hypothetical protein
MAEALPAAGAAIARQEVVDDAAATLAFPELVYAHFDWFRLVAEGAPTPAAEERYRAALARFERQHGEIVNSYWCSEVPSAVAMTSRAQHPFSRLRSPVLTFHRLTDWVTKGQPDLAYEIQRCDEFAIKASSVLGGVRERICMHLVMASAGHLLSLVDARAKPEDEKETEAALERERERLDHIDDYYRAAANGQAQIIYFVGMAAVAAALVVLAILLRFASGDRYVFGALAAGAIGAVVSVLQRISANDFALEFDVGRRYVLFVGGLRPALGAVFGLAVYFAFTSGLVSLRLPDSPDSTKRFYAILALAFVAGFNERWAQDTLATASGSPKPVATDPPRRAAEARRRRSGESADRERR